MVSLSLRIESYSKHLMMYNNSYLELSESTEYIIINYQNLARTGIVIMEPSL